MSDDRTYNRLSYDDWFLLYLTAHPQLQYDKTKEHLYEFQCNLQEQFHKYPENKLIIINKYNEYLSDLEKINNIFIAEHKHLQEQLETLLKIKQLNINNLIQTHNNSNS